jgi:glyoxalase family protein
MDTALAGIHHVTAVTGDAQMNIDFYTKVLGLRLIKVVATFDAMVEPSYHLSYGDTSGTPGTLLTFVETEDVGPGRAGKGLINFVSFAIPRLSLGFWLGHLIAQGIDYKGPTRRFDEQVVSFHDPDGLNIELVAHADTNERPGWESKEIPAEHAIRGFHSVTMWTGTYAETSAFMTDLLGFRLIQQGENVARFAIGAGGPGSYLDVTDAHGFWEGEVGQGIVHHVAWSVANEQELDDWITMLDAHGVEQSGKKDFKYFHSTSFHEPGGSEFEIATAGPGFTVDESVEELGAKIQLPPEIEPFRDFYEQEIIQLRLPTAPKYTFFSDEEEAR